MKDTHKSLEDIDFVTELSMSELKAINGGVGALTKDKVKVVVPPVLPKSGTSTPLFHNIGETPEENINKKKRQLFVEKLQSAPK